MDRTTQREGHAVFVRNQWMLSIAQLFSGVGVAVGFAVGGLLAEQLTGHAEYAGFAQTASIVGAGLLALPLARLAERHSRRYSLSLGFGIAALGALVILAGARLASPVLFFVGMLMFGSATASGLQARYAATDTAPDRLKGRALSVVVWATTIGSVAGPNLAGPGGAIGRGLGVGDLAGPFAVSVVAYGLAVVFTSRLRSRARLVDDPAPDAASGMDTAVDTTVDPGVDADAAVDTAVDADAAPVAHTGSVRPTPTPTQRPTLRPTRPTLRESLRLIVARPRAMLGFAAVVLGHTVMVSVMVMTPIHMQHSGDAIEVIGIVISLHILGMYALSPVYGYLADRFGPVPVIWAGFALFTASGVLGIADDMSGSTMPRISAALILLGLGWSACFIAGSTLLTQSVPAAHRVTIQGATDAGMNLGAAVFAAAAGPLLSAGGFTLINAVALGIVVIGVATAVRSLRAHARAVRAGGTGRTGGTGSAGSTAG